MTQIAKVAQRIILRYRSPEVGQGGVYWVDEDTILDVCHEVKGALLALGLPAIVAWSESRGYLSDVSPEMMQKGMERDYRLNRGGVAVVGLRDSDFERTEHLQLASLMEVKSDLIPKRMVAYLVMSQVAGMLGTIVEDMRGE